MPGTWLDSSCIAIVGARGSGKSSCAYHLLGQMTKPVYVFAHPKPWLITERGWGVLHRLEEMYDIGAAAVWIDEGQLTIPTGNKRANEGLQKLLSIARHRDITLVLSTCDTRWITRALEAYIDVWLVKDIDAGLVKNGSTIKRIIKRHVIIDPDEFHLRPDQYLQFGRDWPEHDGLHTFAQPEFFTDEHSKPFSVMTPGEEVRREVHLESVLRSALEPANGTARVGGVA